MLVLDSVPVPVVTARIDRFIAEDGKGPYPNMEWVGERTRLACRFERVAVASRLLPRRLAETNSSPFSRLSIMHGFSTRIITRLRCMVRAIEL